MHHRSLDTAPRALWKSLIAFLPACPGCGVVLYGSVTSADELCVECLERSRESVETELGGEA